MFFLHKDWQDAEDGIEAVVLHWTSTRLEETPNWRKAHQATMMTPRPSLTPGLRRCTLWITPPVPSRRLFVAGPEQKTAGFLLHSFCEVIQRGRVWSTGITSQEIRAVTVSHVDPSAECTQAFLYYSLDDLAHINCVPMVLDGLPARYRFSPITLPEGRLSDVEFRALARRSKFIARLPPPHMFRGQLWGPVGMRARYTVYLSRHGAYNPFSEGGFWLLRSGGPWEVTV
jgi:hypothetical protein